MPVIQNWRVRFEWGSGDGSRAESYVVKAQSLEAAVYLAAAENAEREKRYIKDAILSAVEGARVGSAPDEKEDAK